MRFSTLNIQMKYIITFLISFVFIVSSNAQRPSKTETFKLLGQVIDDKGEPLPYVAVALFHVKDSSYAKGTATEMNGKFTLDISAGNYYAKVSFLSFEDKTINGINISNKDVDLKKIQLKPSLLNLDEFELVEEKKLMELDLDKRVFNVDKDITNQGANASEI